MRERIYGSRCRNIMQAARPRLATRQSGAGGLDLGEGLDEVEALRVPGEVVGDHVSLDALDVDGGVFADRLRERGVAAGVRDGVDVHVPSQVRDELLLAPGEEVRDAGGEVGSRQDLRELERRQGRPLREKRDGRVAGDDHGRQVRHEAEDPIRPSKRQTSSSLDIVRISSTIIL
jgi:hypothetical protein